MLHDDFRGVGPKGFVLAKEPWIEGHASGQLKYPAFELSELQAHAFGSGTAVAIAILTQHGSHQGHAMQGRFRTTLVWVGERLASAQLSEIALPKADAAASVAI